MNRMRYFLDTYALIEISEGNSKHQKYLESETVTLKDNLAELYYYMLKKYGEEAAKLSMGKFSRIVDELPIEIIPDAMAFKFQNKDRRFSYIDCLGYSFAKGRKMVFLTGDRAFGGFSNVEIVR